MTDKKIENEMIAGLFRLAVHKDGISEDKETDERVMNELIIKIGLLLMNPMELVKIATSNIDEFKHKIED